MSRAKSGPVEALNKPKGEVARSTAEFLGRRYSLISALRRRRRERLRFTVTADQTKLKRQGEIGEDNRVVLWVDVR